MDLRLEDQDGQAINVLDLREVLAGIEQIGHGEVHPIQVVNRGESKIRMITVSLTGEDSNRAQIAMDTGNDPIWAEPGMPLIYDGVLDPDQSFGILARGVYDPSDAEGRYNFSMLLRGTAF